MSQHDKGSYNYLLTLGAVVAAASVRFHVRLVAGGVDAFLSQADHAFADLWRWYSALLVTCHIRLTD
jgi:hypothetical protein